MYLIVNGLVSAAVSFLVLLVTGKPLATTPYSVLMATLIVLSAACSLVVTFKAYQKGSVATFCVIGIVGGILLNCLWGVLFLNEQLTVFGYIGIVLMLVAALLMVEHDGQRSDKSFWIYCILALILNAAVGLLSKQHQVETHFPIVDTLSFSIWIGMIRFLLFSFAMPFLLLKKGKEEFKAPVKAIPLAIVSSALSGSAYVVSLFVNIHVPIVISSPLGTGIGLLLSAVLPILFFHETLSKRQIRGVVISFLGVLIYLLSA